MIEIHQIAAFQSDIQLYQENERGKNTILLNDTDVAEIIKKRYNLDNFTVSDLTDALERREIGQNNELIEQLNNFTFWMDDLLRLARELQKDLKNFYEPIKGWPLHIEALEGHTDYDSVLESGKALLGKRRLTSGSS